jgi:sulfur-oxidizing protein SoxB
MLSRRDFAQIVGATAAVTGLGGLLHRSAAQQKLTQADLLKFNAKGQVTILHMTDCHAQLKPVYFREPSTNLGVGPMTGLPPHVTGKDYLEKFGIQPGTAMAYAHTMHDYEALAKSYGKVGGMDRMATIIKAIRAERGNDRVLLLDGGDTLHGSYTALQSKGGDMVRVMQALGVEATVGHWEFTLGHARITELFGEKDKLGTTKIPFLANNIRDNEFEESVFDNTRFFEKGGVRIAVIGQAFPFTPIANPRWMIPKWSFGIREAEVQKSVDAARKAGAAVVILLSHNGFDVDRKLAGRIQDIDFILTAHTHDALPIAEKVGKVHLIASGSHTKFLSRLDLDIAGGRVKDFNYALIPILADAISPDKDMAALIKDIRGPHEAMLSTTLATTDGLLYRRGNVQGTLDDMICDALMAERDAEISLSPGFRWGNTLVAGDPITWDDVYNATGMTYPNVYRTTMTGQTLKTILEDVCDNLFNVDPYYQQGGDMVRVGGMKFDIHVDKTMGNRIQNMTHLKSGQLIDAKKEYTVAGWASIAENTQGPPIWDVVGNYLKRTKTVKVTSKENIKLVRG